MTEPTVEPVQVDMTGNDINTVLKNLDSIMNTADKLIEAGAAVTSLHHIYKLARDSRDIMTWEKIGLDVLKKLSEPDEIVVDGVTVPYLVKELISAGQFIDAIKELRSSSGLGLKEAKDICEIVRSEMTRSNHI